MNINGYEDCKLVELTIEMLRGTPNEIFSLSHEYFGRGLDVFTSDSPIAYAFSVSFVPKYINAATRNTLIEFAKLGSLLYLNRLFAGSEATLLDSLYKKFDESNCGLRSTVADLMVAVDEELCMMHDTNKTKQNVLLFQNTPIMSHTFESLLQLHLHCRHWVQLFQSVVEVIQTTCLQLKSVDNAHSVTCSLLQQYHQHLIKSTLIELPSHSMHSTSTVLWGPNRATRLSRWKSHANRWFDLFVVLSYQTMLNNLLRRLMDRNEGSLNEESVVVFPSFLTDVASTLVTTVNDLHIMHTHTSGVHTPHDFINKRNSILQAINEASQVFQKAQRLSVLPTSLLDGSPLFRYLTTGKAVKKVGLRPTVSSESQLLTPVKSIASNSLEHKESSSSASGISKSFLKSRWFNGSPNSVAKHDVNETSTSLTSSSSSNLHADDKDCNTVVVNAQHSEDANTSEENVLLRGTLPLKFQSSYGTLLVDKLQTLGKTVAQLVNSEHHILQQLQFVRDVYYLGQGSLYFAPLRALCESLVYSVLDVVSRLDQVSSVDTDLLILSMNTLITEAKPVQPCIESVTLTTTTVSPTVGGNNSKNNTTELSELTLLSCLSNLSVDIVVHYPMKDILTSVVVAKLNKVFRILSQLQLVKWLYEFWWKAGVSSGLLSIIRSVPLPQSTVVSRHNVEDVDLTVNRLKTNCTVGLNLILRTVSTLLSHFVSSVHYTFSDVFETQLDHTQCLVREYAVLLHDMVTKVESLLIDTSDLILELVSVSMLASRYLRSAVVLEKQYVGILHDEPSYFSVILSYRKAEEAFVNSRRIVNKLKKCVEESGATDLLYKL